MLETIRIRRQGFPVRPSHLEFISRFRNMAFGASETVATTASNCLKILAASGLKGFHVGYVLCGWRNTRGDYSYCFFLCTKKYVGKLGFF
jgi:hypothetical protein